MRLRSCAMSGVATGAAFAGLGAAGAIMLRGLIRSTEDAGSSRASAAADFGAPASADGAAGFNMR